MQQMQFQNKYPIRETRIEKTETTAANAVAIIDRLKQNVDQDERTAFIGLFDHMSHTKSLQGEIADEIIDARHIVFCFGIKLPNAQVMAVRPRSIGVTEFDDHFVINFLEPPMPMATEAMESWVEELRDR